MEIGSVCGSGKKCVFVAGGSVSMMSLLRQNISRAKQIQSFSMIIDVPNQSVFTDANQSLQCLRYSPFETTRADILGCFFDIAGAVDTLSDFLGGVTYPLSNLDNLGICKKI